MVTPYLCIIHVLSICQLTFPYIHFNQSYIVTHTVTQSSCCCQTLKLFLSGLLLHFQPPISSDQDPVHWAPHESCSRPNSSSYSVSPKRDLLSHKILKPIFSTTTFLSQSVIQFVYSNKPFGLTPFHWPSGIKLSGLDSLTLFSFKMHEIIIESDHFTCLV